MTHTHEEHFRLASRNIEVRRNPDGTLHFQLAASVGTQAWQFAFDAQPFLDLELTVAPDDSRMETLREEQVTSTNSRIPAIRVPSRSFSLTITGVIKYDQTGQYMATQLVSSPFGDGYDECGNRIKD